MEITVTHTLAPEVIDILRNFIAGKDPLALVEKTEKKKVTAKSEKAQAEPEPEPEAVASTAQTEYTKKASNTISTETLRAKTAEVIQSGKRAEVAQLLTEFGVGKLTELPKTDYTSFYKKVTEL